MSHKALILKKFLYSKKIFERFTKEYLINFTVFMENELYQPKKRKEEVSQVPFYRPV